MIQSVSHSASPELDRSSRESHSRSVDPFALVTHLESTVPFLFERDFGKIEGRGEPLPYVAALDEVLRSGTRPFPGFADQAGYFRFCLSAHWASVASFAPVEVESLIRYKLWQDSLPTDVIHEMAETVLEAYHWDFTAVSRRWMSSPYSRLVLSSHHGEWFAVAVAAYGATRERDPFLAQRLREAIEFEVTREAKIYLETRKARDGVSLLMASSLIAQNLADLDRAIETWRIGSEDPLFEFAYRASHAGGTRGARFGGALAEAGKMNKAYMAAENHRHFALRIPRVLRRSSDFLLPLAPFLDDWGTNLANHSALRTEDLGALIETLYLAWDKLKGPEGSMLTHAYPRAVAGILAGTPYHGTSAFTLETFTPFLSPAVERNLRTGLFFNLLSVPKSRFHEQWGTLALALLR